MANNTSPETNSPTHPSTREVVHLAEGYGSTIIDNPSPIPDMYFGWKDLNSPNATPGSEAPKEAADKPYIPPVIIRPDLVSGVHFDFSKLPGAKTRANSRPTPAEEAVPALDAPNIKFEGWQGAIRRRRMRNARSAATEAARGAIVRPTVADAIVNGRLPNPGPANIETGAIASRTVGDRVASKHVSRMRTKLMQQELEKNRLEDNAGKTNEHGVPIYLLDNNGHIRKDPKTGNKILRPSDLGTAAQLVRLNNGYYSRQQRSHEMKVRRQHGRVVRRIKRLSGKIGLKVSGDTGHVDNLAADAILSDHKALKLEDRYENRDVRREDKAERGGGLIKRAVKSVRESATDLHIDNMRATAARLRIEAGFHENGNGVDNMPANKDNETMAAKATKKQEKARKLGHKIGGARVNKFVRHTKWYPPARD